MKEKDSILHLMTPAKNMSPFDVNMAIDAGFNHIVPYTQVALSEVAGLTQDAIFSRSASGLAREAIFIGGRDIELAAEMFDAAKKAMLPPFEVSIFADPSGAFTTAAAMLAKVEFHLNKHFQLDLSGRQVAILGATGAVGGCAAVIAAELGAEVVLVAHKNLADVHMKAEAYNARYGTRIVCVDGASDETKQAAINRADVVLCCAKAGVRVVSLQHIMQSATLKIIADVNAVAPSGAEGVESMADGVLIAHTQVVGIGALAIGRLKYNTQHHLLKQMLSPEKPCYLDFMAALNVARRLILG